MMAKRMVGVGRERGDGLRRFSIVNTWHVGSVIRALLCCS